MSKQGDASDISIIKQFKTFKNLLGMSSDKKYQ